ncbi:probable protein SENSITIVITY TO RED LIGHT REDUCED 1 at N-terminal half [Coccomyxa sp. Obi]|nr:probable protein SENSITIVITY TO RED LIGHT REDUCED 1 at N-terminal half [Coccomyxa sp. Obi]
MEWTVVERRGRRNVKPYRQGSCEGPQVPTELVKAKQAVKGRFKEKSLEEKVQDMFTQVQRMKAEIADSKFYRNFLPKLNESEQLWMHIQEERCKDNPDSIVPASVAQKHDAQGSAEPDMHVLSAQLEASVGLHGQSTPNSKLAATEEGTGKQGGLHSVGNIGGVWRWSKVEEMVIFGLGSMENDRNPRYQLAFALLLAGHLPGLQGPIQVFDPRFTELDRMFLREQGFLVLDENERCRRCVTRPTLFYMPHVGLNLCNNLVEANAGSPENMAILGNTFSRYHERWADAGSIILQQVKHPPPDALLHVVESGRVLELRTHDHEFPVVSAFNDMSLHLFPPTGASRSSPQNLQVTALVVAGSGMDAVEPISSDNPSEKRKLPVAGSTAFQAWLDEEEEEWRIGQRLAATCPAEFICPISLDIMTEPVILAETGMTYERAAIRKWFFLGGDTCPLTGVRLSTTKVMAHKHLQRRIEKWVRARGMTPDEESTVDSLKAAVQSSFDESDLAPPPPENGIPVPGSPGASTAPSTVGASTIGPSSIHKMSKPGKARSEGSSSRRGGSRRRTAANEALAAADANVKRGSILLRALSSSTLAQLTRPSSQGPTPDPNPCSRCETVCEGDPSCELDAPEGASEDAGLRAPPNSPAVLPRGQGMLCRHTRTMSHEELPRAERGSRISVTNPIYKDFTRAASLPGSAKAAASLAHIHATCSAGSEHVELVEGPVVEELQAEKVSLPVEEGSVVLGEAASAAAAPAAPDSGTARDASGSLMAAAAQGEASKSRKKKKSRKPKWVSVIEAAQPLAATDRMHQFEGASRCTSTASYYTSPEAHGWQEAEEIVTPTAPSDSASVLACHKQPAERTGGGRWGLLHSLSRSFTRRGTPPARREPTPGHHRPRSAECGDDPRDGGARISSMLPPRLSETGTAATSGALVVRGATERPRWAATLRRMALLSTATTAPGLALAALQPTMGCLGYRLFWSRCFGCMSAPDVLSLDIPDDAGLRLQSIMDADQYFQSEQDEIVSVHTFAQRIMADYMPPVTAGLRDSAGR